MEIFKDHEESVDLRRYERRVREMMEKYLMHAKVARQ